MSEPATQSPGRLLATTLAGSWRECPDPLSLDLRDLDQVTPLLYGSGAAALGWWCLRENDLRESPSGEILHQAYRLLVLQARTHETRIQKIFRLLRTANVEPILIKGWAIARHYPQTALRPYGDIDLLVRPADLDAAKSIVASEEARDCWIDLHARLSQLTDRSIDDLFARSRLVNCGEEEVRVLAAEDHFGLLAIHLLQHGAWRPVWLCDIALLLESMNDFDWSLCLGNEKRRVNWILAAVGLAVKLLGARARDEMIASKASPVPLWLTDSVLKAWATPFAGSQPPMSHPAPMRSYLRHPRGLRAGLATRWPNPILATMSVNGQFNRWPRWPYQIGNLLSRAGRLVLRHNAV